MSEYRVTDATEANQWDPNFSLIDDIVSGDYKKYVSNNDLDVDQDDNVELPTQSKAADTTPLDLARLAGLAKQGYNKLDQLSRVGEPAAQPPKALPAPAKPEFDLTPDLKQKQAEPIKKKPDES